MTTLSALLVLMTLPAGRSSCIIVASDRILAGDLAATIPEFGSVDAHTAIGFAPIPGARRTILPQELQALARDNGVEMGPHPPAICIERPMHVLSRDSVEEAIHRVVPDYVQIEVLGYSQYAVPEGPLEFPLRGLSFPPRGDAKVPVRWLGRVVYGQDRHFSVWAQVRLSAKQRRLVAAVPLTAGAPIRAGQVRLEDKEEFPFPVVPPTPESAVVGKISRRSYAPGEVIQQEYLREAPAVTRGQTVQVTLEDEGLTLQFIARADSTGKPGDSVVIENQDTHVKFQGIVESPDHVIVRSDSRGGAATP